MSFHATLLEQSSSAISASANRAVNADAVVRSQAECALLLSWFMNGEELNGRASRQKRGIKFVFKHYYYYFDVRAVEWFASVGRAHISSEWEKITN